MTAAHVEFMTLDGRPCPPDEKPARFTFECVFGNRDRDPRLPRRKCGNPLIAEGPHSAAHGIRRDGQNANGGRAQWDWNGDRAAPTFSPSVNCEGRCGWHGYVENGRCVNTSKQDEPGD